MSVLGVALLLNFTLLDGVCCSTERAGVTEFKTKTFKLSTKLDCSKVGEGGPKIGMSILFVFSSLPAASSASAPQSYKVLRN